MKFLGVVILFCVTGAHGYIPPDEDDYGPHRNLDEGQVRHREREVIKHDRFVDERGHYPTHREIELRREEIRRENEKQKIAACETGMENCVYTPEELVEKILELEGDDDDWGDGFPDEGPEPEIESIPKPGRKGTHIDSVGPRVPRYCNEYCVRSYTTKRYRFDCRQCLKDQSLRYFYQKKRKMLKCFRCRGMCYKANADQYM